LRFAPHFARTIQTLNHAIPEHISDHNPIVADLPLAEPGHVPEAASSITSNLGPNDGFR
jgi:hypothetical protein